MVIRKASVADTSLIRRLLEQLGYPQLEDEVVDAINTYDKEGYQILVGEDDKDVVGFVSLHWFDMFHSRGQMGRITAICILEELRSKGFGQALLMAAEHYLKTKGCVKVEVTTNLNRTLTHEFYGKNGYSIDSKRFIKRL
jgi:GNAT superfamily N-acetyltransferase